MPIEVWSNFRDRLAYLGGLHLADGVFQHSAAD